MKQLTPSEQRRERDRLNVLSLVTKFKQQGMRPEEAVNKTAPIVGLSRRTIYSIIKKSKENEQHVEK